MAKRLAVGLLVILLLGGCPQGPQGSSPTDETVRQGDQCRVEGAVGHTNTGKLLNCGRHRGLDYYTWDVG